MKKLFIIGNGFDRHHNMETGYWDFRDYLMENDSDILDTIEMFNIMTEEELWSDFEANMANIDGELMFEYHSYSLVDPSSDDWRDSDNHVFNQLIDKDVKNMSEKLIAQFAKWIHSVDMPEELDEGIAKRFAEVKDSYFLNFNYTPTLQNVYGIDNSKILHIHNQVEHEDSEIILGHALKVEPEVNLELADDNDIRVSEGICSIKQYYIDTYKQVDSVIAQNESFFNSSYKYDEIIIMGHSLSDVDFQYFEKIAMDLCHESTRWVVSYHGDNEEEEDDDIYYKRRNLEICLKPNNEISFFRLCDLSRD